MTERLGDGRNSRVTKETGKVRVCEREEKEKERKVERERSGEKERGE